MGFLAFTVLMQRWASAKLQQFDTLFFTKSLETRPSLVPAPVTSPSWLVALESASRGWSSWHT